MGTVMKKQSKSSIRERKRQVVRDALHQVAMKLFLQRDYDDVTVDDIAREAGVSRRTFFHAFETKEDAILRNVEDMGHVMAQLLSIRPKDEPPIESFRQIAGPALIVSLGDPETARERVRLVRDTPALRARRLKKMDDWVGALAEVYAQRMGLASPQGLPRLTAWICVATLDVAMLEWSYQEKDPPEKFLDRAFTNLGKVLAAPPQKPAKK